MDDHHGSNVYKKKVPSIKILETKEGIKALVGVVQNSIMHGALHIRCDSAYCFKYFIDFASPVAIKTEIIKICGALIRVVNDKFPPELKIQIFFSFRLMLVKCAIMVKAMAAQIQTTLLRAICDPTSNEEVRMVVIENLLLLIKMVPKTDPIVKELTSQLDGTKADGEQKMQISHALALILREKGKNLQEAVSRQAYTVLSQIVEERKAEMNDQVLVNSAIGLGFLSAFSQETSQMKDLFYHYDGSKDPRVCLGVKLGVLMNGSANIPEKEKLEADAAEYLTNVLKTASGVVEIDGKDITENRPEEEIFRFDGALGVTGHILNIYVRRLYKPDSAQAKLVFKAISASKLFETLNEEEDFMPTSKIYEQILPFIECLPVPSISAKPATIGPELAEVMKDMFTFIQKFYLEFDSKKDAKQALLNLLTLTYNNGMDLSVSTAHDEVIPINNDFIRQTACELPQLNGVISTDMKIVCNDIVFAQE
mmetsp:Transcript_34907/g.53570  ORF Transcript_34907/g.53570 Transcript_34907/m.53570 type:complete len:481 (-) Transcript_34907:50-1492(-)